MSVSVPQIEPAVFFIVMYYASTSQNEPPETYYPLLKDYNSAITFANDKMVEKDGVGVCLIQQLGMIAVYTPHTLDTSFSGGGPLIQA